jgi:hypothetical protein
LQLVNNVLGLSWNVAVPVGLAVALAFWSLQGMLEVSEETLTYTPQQGVLLEGRRRMGPAVPRRVLPMRRLVGLDIHQVRA